MWGTKYVIGVAMSLLFAMEEKKSTPLDVVILSGQSNMAGRGGVQSKRLPNGTEYKEWDGFVPSDSRAEHGSILRLNADLNWENAKEPLHSDIDLGKVCGIGPGLTFAATVVNHCKQTTPSKNCTMGLVPCARGATSITEWVKGSQLYEAMVHRANEAIKKGGTLRALLWYQGESDTMSEHLARHYKTSLEEFVKSVRADLHHENLPFVQVGITAKNHPHPHLLRIVREAQRAVNIPHVYYVDAQGLDIQDDGIHLTTHSQVQLGKQLADSFISNVLTS